MSEKPSYLWEAFKARPFGMIIPPNFFGLAAFGLLGAMVNPGLWLIGAGLEGLYLWWLSALLFDLTFVWHWYIRHSKLNEKLRDWQKDSLPQKKPVLAPPPTTVALTP